MLKKSLINSNDYLKNGFMSEIKIMQTLKGNNVVRFLEVIETGNNYYIIQEFCAEGDFEQYLYRI